MLLQLPDSGRSRNKTRLSAIWFR